MKRTELLMDYIRRDKNRSRQFSVLDRDEGKVIIRSQATMGRTDMPLMMIMIVRDGSQFCDFYARICVFREKSMADRLAQYANFIQNNYSGIRAGIQYGDNGAEYYFYISIENFFREDDDDIEQLFYLDGYLTYVISVEYDKIMKILYS